MKTQRRRNWARVAGMFGVLLVLSASGCSGSIYGIMVTSASSKLETAKALNAEEYAPYEYYYAEAHLWKAMEEAAAADYGDALDLTAISEEYAEKAIVLSRQAHQGAGR